jgi:hypothetical protein
LSYFVLSTVTHNYVVYAGKKKGNMCFKTMKTIILSYFCPTFDPFGPILSHFVLFCPMTVTFHYRKTTVYF